LGGNVVWCGVNGSGNEVIVEEGDKERRWNRSCVRERERKREGERKQNEDERKRAISEG
jgi:hypothetical protein